MVGILSKEIQFVLGIIEYVPERYHNHNVYWLWRHLYIVVEYSFILATYSRVPINSEVKKRSLDKPHERTAIFYVVRLVTSIQEPCQTHSHG